MMGTGCRSALVAGFALALAGCGGGGMAAAPQPQVTGAWIRLPAAPGRPAAGYFTLQAGGQPATLLKVASPIAMRTELHESMAGSGGMMSMKPLAQVAVPAGGTVSFAPGGKHVMLFDLSPAAKSGDTSTLRLSFAESRDPMEVPARLIGPGDPAP